MSWSAPHDLRLRSGGGLTRRTRLPRELEFDRELGEPEGANDLARRRRHARGSDDRRDRQEHVSDLLHVDVRLLRAPRFSRYEAGGASTATSAAMRTSISDRGSRFDASIEAAVMVVSRSMTGVSEVPWLIVSLLPSVVHDLRSLRNSVIGPLPPHLTGSPPFVSVIRRPGPTRRAASAVVHRLSG